MGHKIMRWRLGDISFTLTNRTGSQMESDCRFLGKVIVHFHMCVFWAWGDLMTKYFFCASRTVEAISGVLRKDPAAPSSYTHFLHISCFMPGPLCFFPIPLPKWWPLWKLLPIMSNSHRHTPESHCILCSSANNNFLSILFAEKIVVSLRKRTS